MVKEGETERNRVEQVGEGRNRMEQERAEENRKKTGSSKVEQDERG